MKLSVENKLIEVYVKHKMDCDQQKQTGNQKNDQKAPSWSLSDPVTQRS
jgi:hypothetical protein